MNEIENINQIVATVSTQLQAEYGKQIVATVSQQLQTYRS